MRVDDILKVKGRNVSTATPDAAVIRVVERMRLERIGSFVVSDDGRRIQGVITERDIISAIARRGADAAGPACSRRDDPIGTNLLAR